MGFPGGSVSKESPCSAGDLGLIPGSGRSSVDPHSSILTWEIPWTEPGVARLQSMGWQRVRHNLATKPPSPHTRAHTHTHTHTYTYITESPHVHLKLTRYCKSTRLRFKKQKNEDKGREFGSTQSRDIWKLQFSHLINRGKLD